MSIIVIINLRYNRTKERGAHQMKHIAEDTRWSDYMIVAAQHSKYNAQHWFRYLRKDVDKCGIALKEAFEEGSDTQEYIRSLNRKARPVMLAEIRSRYEARNHHGG